MAIDKILTFGTGKVGSIGSGKLMGLKFDPYFQASDFISVANITDTTQQNAINYLVQELVDNNLMSKFNFIYPFVGGDATRHSYNLVDTSLYQLTFNGGWTHSTTGATPNGTNTYATTGFVPSNISGTDNAHFSYYSRTNAQTASELIMGSNSFGSTPFSYLQIRDAGNRTQGVFSSSETNQPTYIGTTDSTGLFMANFQSNTLRQILKNKTVLNQNTVNLAIGKSTAPIYLASYNNNGTPLTYTTKQCAFASAGNGMSNTEQALFYDIVQQFQTILGRNV